MKGDPKIELVEVARLHDEMKARMIQSALEGSGIESMISGETLNLTHGASYDGHDEIAVLVRKEDEARARDVVDAVDIDD